MEADGARSNVRWCATGCSHAAVAGGCHVQGRRSMSTGHRLGQPSLVANRRSWPKRTPPAPAASFFPCGPCIAFTGRSGCRRLVLHGFCSCRGGGRTTPVFRAIRTASMASRSWRERRASCSWRSGSYSLRKMSAVGTRPVVFGRLPPCAGARRRAVALVPLLSERPCPPPVAPALAGRARGTAGGGGSTACASTRLTQVSTISCTRACEACGATRDARKEEGRGRRRLGAVAGRARLCCGGAHWAVRGRDRRSTLVICASLLGAAALRTMYGGGAACRFRSGGALAARGGTTGAGVQVTASPSITVFWPLFVFCL
jgi:hypothetical protein